MLAAANRLRTSAEFSKTVRSGVRHGRRNVVVYVVPTDSAAPTIVGFIVAKTVGNAVRRNLVKRRLRELAAESLHGSPCGLAIVVRALPPAQSASWQELGRDYRNALGACLRKLEAKESVEKGQGA